MSPGEAGIGIALAVGTGIAAAIVYVFALWLPDGDSGDVIDWPRATLLIVAPLVASLLLPGRWSARLLAAVLGSSVALLATLLVVVALLVLGAQ